MINAALIGLGWWGKNLAKSIQATSSDIQFGLAVTKEVAEAREFASKYGLSLSDRFEDALENPQIQAVVLATPHSMHADQIVAAAEAGKHVFCEKPLALNSADAKRAIHACESRGLALAVGQNKRFWPSMVKLRQTVASGALGQILHVEGHYSNEHSTKFFSDWRDSPSESPAGGLTGTGIHIIDAFVGLVGPAVEVSAQVFSVRSGRDPRDATSVTVRFANGVNGFFAMVRATPFFWRVHVFGDSASAEAVHLTRDLLAYGVQTILFARSRRAVERILRNLRNQEPGQSEAVHGYRSGYLPGERRQIEQRLQSGEARAVIATNALELGIDIGSMDASLLVGYPGTIASTIQQFGRAGRRSGPALGILVASGNPLDQYLIQHPEYIFERSPEGALIDPNNLLILLHHLECAAFELPAVRSA